MRKESKIGLSTILLLGDIYKPCGSTWGEGGFSKYPHISTWGEGGLVTYPRGLISRKKFQFDALALN